MFENDVLNRYLIVATIARGVFIDNEVFIIDLPGQLRLAPVARLMGIGTQQ